MSVNPWWTLGGAIFMFMLLPKKSRGANNEGLSYLGRMDLPRGLRNNNPGNLKISPASWLGKISELENRDGTFEQFRLYVFGVRAMTVLLKNYMDRYGLNTIEKIVKRYAPATENHTDKYIAFVADQMGITPTTPIKPEKYTLKKLVQAMAIMENGKDAISDDQFNKAWTLIT